MLVKALITTLYVLGFVSLFQPVIAVQSTITPMPDKIGRATIAWEVEGASRWEIIGCPQMERCTVYGRGGSGQQRGSLEVTPNVGDRFYLNAWQGSVSQSHLLGEIPGDWSRHWVVLPVVHR